MCHAVPYSIVPYRTVSWKAVELKVLLWIKFCEWTGVTKYEEDGGNTDITKYSPLCIKPILFKMIRNDVNLW